MEAVVDVKYRPVLFPNGVAAVAAAETKKLRQAPGGESVYRECLKNHAASLGGHAVDGCGEFMPSPAANPSDPTSLKCAACGCHRNFHRRLQEAPPSPPRLALPPPPPAVAVTAVSAPHLMQGGHPQRGEETPEDRLPAAGEDDSEDSDEGSDYDDGGPASPLPATAVAPPGYISSAPHMLLSLSSGAPGSAPVVMASRPPAPVPGAPPSASAARKRFRTKFSPEQKQRMQALSEQLGWRLQKRDEVVVDECCREIGVGKGVFKVWMHNNKHNFLGGHSARRSASAGATLRHPSTHPNPPPAPTAASAPPAHADFNINGSSISAADNPLVQPATASGGSGSPQSS